MFGGCGDPTCSTGLLIALPALRPADNERDNEQIWCAIEVAEIAGVIDDYELSKDGPWYHDVDWVAASAALDGLLRAHSVDGQVQHLHALADAASTRMRTVDTGGLFALVMEPITITPIQVTSGGHRLNAMLQQGVTTVPGLFSRSDIPELVPADRVYPLGQPPVAL